MVGSFSVSCWQKSQKIEGVALNHVAIIRNSVSSCATIVVFCLAKQDRILNQIFLWSQKARCDLLIIA